MIRSVRHILPINMLFCFLCLALTACAVAPSKPETGYDPQISEKAAQIAVSMIGRPYKYRGESPSGFDCSGLVRYSYLTAGVDAPHGTKELLRVTRRVELKKAKTGDLLFFSERGRKYSHVGVYLDNELFVHAPATGGKVRKESLSDPYWKKSFVEARRFQ